MGWVGVKLHLRLESCYTPLHSAALVLAKMTRKNDYSPVVSLCPSVFLFG